MMKSLRFAMFSAALTGIQLLCGSSAAEAQTSVFSVQRTDSLNQIIDNFFSTAQDTPFPPANTSGPTSSSNATLTTQSKTSSRGSGSPYATVSAILTAEQNCAQGATVANPTGQSVISATFAVVSTSASQSAFRTDRVFSQAVYQILAAASGATTPVAYHSVQFLFSGGNNSTPIFTVPATLQAHCDSTLLTATNSGSGFMITGVVGNGGSTTGYMSGPWGNNINQTINGVANHAVSDSFTISTEIRNASGPYGALVFQTGPGTVNHTLGIGVYSFCIIDDH